MNANVPRIRPLYSGELARLAGISTDTLRYYERRGLVQPVPRSSAGYRLFSAELVERVRLIRAALSIGFSVNELIGIFSERDGGKPPCHQVRNLAAKKLRSIEGQIKDLRAWHRELRKTLADWNSLLRKTPSGKRAGLLEAFAATHPIRHAGVPPRRMLPRTDHKQEKRK
jgi:DNA-binding transcriptional MerR regulator